MADNKIIMGRLGSTYGVRGWLKLISFTEPAEKILEYQNLQIQYQQQWQPLQLENSKAHGKGSIIKISGYDTPEAARQLTNNLIAIERDELPQCAADEYYWADLVGCTVTTTTGVELGKIDHLLETGANDVIVIQGEQKHLIPLINQFVLAVDLKQKTITVDWDLED